MRKFYQIISPFPLQYQVDERYAPEYPPIWAVVSSRPNGGLLQAVNNSLSRQKSQMERLPSSLHAFTLLVMPLCVTTGVTRPEEGHGFGCCVTKIFGRHEFTGSWNVKNQPWTKMNCLDVTTKTAALSKNSGKLRFYDFCELCLRLWFWER